MGSEDKMNSENSIENTMVDGLVEKMLNSEDPYIVKDDLIRVAFIDLLKWLVKDPILSDLVKGTIKNGGFNDLDSSVSKKDIIILCGILSNIFASGVIDDVNIDKKRAVLHAKTFELMHKNQKKDLNAFALVLNGQFKKRDIDSKTEFEKQTKKLKELESKVSLMPKGRLEWIKVCAVGGIGVATIVFGGIIDRYCVNSGFC